MKVERPEESRQPELRVCILEKSYSTDISRLEKAIHLGLEDAEQCDCGIDVNGKPDHFYGCANEAFDEWEGTYCKMQRTRELQQQQSDYFWLPSMLKYYWQHGIDEDGIVFLSRVGFVHSYAYAAKPYPQLWS